MAMTLLQALIRIRDKGPADTSVGICANVDKLIRGIADAGLLLRPLFATWPKSTTTPAYPVPVSGYHCPCEGYWSMKGMRPAGYWLGEQGELRRELLEHCIAELASREPPPKLVKNRVNRFPNGTTVRWFREDAEWQVRSAKGSTYHTNERDDALSTALHMDLLA